MYSSTPYRGRFAPSPSGALHFGSLVAALGSYLDARKNRGQWLLRIEDLDPPREKPGASDEIIRTLDGFGFEWDGEILYQSHRHEAYEEALTRLAERKILYPCGCTRKEIANAGLEGLEGPIYPGTCRKHLPPGRAARAFRVVTDDRPVSFRDRVCGNLSQKLFTESGDFVVRRADGLFAYQLAVVVDDACQQINQVVRGADLLNSTPRQIYLQRLLDLPQINYAHLPLVLNAEGKKLSKQTRAHPVNRKEPLPALLAALNFLKQLLPPEPPGNLAEFWEWSLSVWDLEKLSVEFRM